MTNNCYKIAEVSRFAEISVPGKITRIHLKINELKFIEADAENVCLPLKHAAHHTR